jgi:hypothetical protein
MNLEELDIAKGNYLTRQNGEEYAIPHHEFSQDIDLFGRGSFFQYMNRTGLKEGAGFLAQSIQSDDISAIRKKQKAVSELSEDPAWLQRYTALAQELDNETPTAPLVHWIAQYKAFLKPVHRFFSACVWYNIFASTRINRFTGYFHKRHRLLDFTGIGLHQSFSKESK